MSAPVFYVGLHQPSDAQHFDRACISVRRLAERRAPIPRCRILLDSGAFTEIALHGGYRAPVAAYAVQIRRMAQLAALDGAVAQDWMCEPWVVAKTGLSVAEHQRRTTARYEELASLGTAGVPLLPVIQGFAPEDYRRHVAEYGALLGEGMWVGVGSVCKRNGSPRDVAAVLSAIKTQRPDLRLHGFGIKKTALADPEVRAMLYSADSMAWSFQARRSGRNPNDRAEAARWVGEVEAAAAEPSNGYQLALALG